MHIDEYRAGFPHRTRSNRPGSRLRDEQDGGGQLVAPVPAGLSDAIVAGYTYPPAVSDGIASALSRELACQHWAIRERLTAGRWTNRECIDCGAALPDREWEN